MKAHVYVTMSSHFVGARYVGGNASSTDEMDGEELKIEEKIGL